MHACRSQRISVSGFSGAAAAWLQFLIGFLLVFLAIGGMLATERIVDPAEPGLDAAGPRWHPRLGAGGPGRRQVGRAIGPGWAHVHAPPHDGGRAYVKEGVKGPMLE